MYGDDTNPYQNTNDSNIKKYIDNWYKTNIKDKGFESSLDKDSIYCGDRTEGSVSGNHQYYGGLDRIAAGKPTMKCPSSDSYGIESGNRKLTYPVGLLSVDEVNLSGANMTGNNNCYLCTNTFYWLISPNVWFSSSYAGVFSMDFSVSYYFVGNTGGVRPAITIAPSAPLISGDGSKESPYII